jgi:hypothetical protein
MTIFVRDTFTDTDNTALASHTGETGATWTLHPITPTGGAQISNANRVHSNTANAAIFTASGTHGAAEYSVSCIVRMVTDLNDALGVIGRLASTTVGNGYTGYAYGGIQFYLSRLDAGVETVLGFVNETYNTAQDYRLELHLANGTKRLFIDGVKKATSADNTYTAAGLIGLLYNLAAGSDTTGSHIDNLVASTPTNYATTISDALSLTDAPSQRAMKAFRGLPQDAVVLLDLLARGQVHGRTTLDSAAVAEVLLRSARGYRGIADSVVVSDVVRRRVDMFRRLLDVLSVTDSLSSTISAGLSVITRLLQDSVSVEDAVRRTMLAYRLPTDSIALVDSLTRTGKMFRFVTDGLSTSDALLATMRAFRLTTEAVVVDDAVSRSTKLIRQLLDSVGVTDSLISSITVAGVTIISRVLHDDLSLDDAIRRGVKAYRLANDDATASDTLGRTAYLTRTVTDILAVAESMARFLLISRIATDSVQAADTAIRYALLNRLLHDDATAEDSLVSNIGYFQLLIGFVMQSLVSEPVVMALDAQQAQLTLARAEHIVMEMHNL